MAELRNIKFYARQSRIPSFTSAYNLYANILVFLFQWGKSKNKNITITNLHH